MAADIETVVIGAGAVGLAIARALRLTGQEVMVLEQHPRAGSETSSRNSEVIHAGIYYPPGSLKAFHCVRGSRMLYEFCERHRVPHRRLGKLIVVESRDQFAALEALRERGEQNGAEGLEIVERDFISRLEPEVVSPLALYSPNTGIVDAEALLKTLARIAEANGAHLLTGTRLIGADVKNGLCVLRTEREDFATRVVVNAAGLYADEVARMFGNDKYTIYPCRGEYAEVVPSRSNLVNGLIYPLPPASGHGLGVHFTKDMAGRLLLGPNARYVMSKEDYENGLADLHSFYEPASQIVPALRAEDLRPGYTGMRARLVSAREQAFADFVIGPDPQWPFVIHTIGIESPGLTAALSIGESISDMARDALR